MILFIFLNSPLSQNGRKKGQKVKKMTLFRSITKNFRHACKNLCYSKLFELFRGDLRWSIAHEIRSACGFGKGDHIANIFRSREKHEQTDQPQKQGPQGEGLHL